MAPPPPPPASASPTAGTPTPATGGKRKRKSDASKGKNTSDRTPDAEETSQATGNAGQPPSPYNTAPASTPLADVHKKRTKTQRACDSCRSRKIRYFYDANIDLYSNILLF